MVTHRTKKLKRRRSAHLRWPANHGRKRTMETFFHGIYLLWTLNKVKDLHTLSYLDQCSQVFLFLFLFNWSIFHHNDFNDCDLLHANHSAQWFISSCFILDSNFPDCNQKMIYYGCTLQTNRVWQITHHRAVLVTCLSFCISTALQVKMYYLFFWQTTRSHCTWKFCMYGICIFHVGYGEFTVIFGVQWIFIWGL